MTDDLPAKLETAMLQANQAALSWRERVGYVALLLVAIAMGVVLIALLVTEPNLPMRTSAAFLIMLLIAAGWTIFAIWVLTKRRPLYSRHRVVAGWMAIAFSALFTAAASIAAWLGIGSAATIAAVAGFLMTGAATLLLLRAKQQRRTLQKQREALTREIGGGEV